MTRSMLSDAMCYVSMVTSTCQHLDTAILFTPNQRAVRKFWAHPWQKARTDLWNAPLDLIPQWAEGPAIWPIIWAKKRNFGILNFFKLFFFMIVDMIVVMIVAIVVIVAMIWQWLWRWYYLCSVHWSNGNEHIDQSSAKQAGAELCQTQAK